MNFIRTAMLVLVAALSMPAQVLAQGRLTDDLVRRAIERCAVEAAIWGMPLVAVDAMRQAYFRDAGAAYGDIVYFSRPVDWRFQTATPSAAALYAYFNFNLKPGPVLVEFPASAGATLSGSLTDAWETPLADLGPDGFDRGRGGKYLLLPPNSTHRVSREFSPVQSHTYNGYALIRVVPASASPADLAKAIEV
jgi:hypothetical protein